MIKFLHWLFNINIFVFAVLNFCSLLISVATAATGPPFSPLPSDHFNNVPLDAKINNASELFGKVNISGSFSNYCSIPCACLGEHFECKKQNLHQVPRLPQWVRSLDLTGNKLDDNVQDNIAELSSLSSLILKKNHITKIPIFRGLSALEKLNLAHNRIQAISNVAISSLPQLKELDLMKNRIKIIDSECFPLHNKIITLNLNNNHVSKITTDAFVHLRGLIELHMNHNGLRDLPHELFKSSHALRKLDMSFNRLNISWAIFKGLDQLRILKLRANGIQSLPDGVFQALKSIDEIDLNSNRITNLSRSGFFNLYTLTSLSLSNNSIKHLEPDTWEFVQQLINLDISFNGLEQISRYNFKCLAKLKKLHLQSNKIQYFEDSSFACLSNLEYLNLSGNRLSVTFEGSPGPFAALKKLEVLDMELNDVKSINRKAFVGLESLECLNLNGNNITTLQSNAFEPLKRIQRLILNSTHFLCDCNLQWLHGWLKARTKLLQGLLAEGLMLFCDYPPEVRGRDLMSLNEKKDFICDESPKPRLIKEPSNQLAIKGTKVALECSAISSASVPMTFQWRRDNIELKANESEITTQKLNNNTVISSFLHLADVSHEHNGKYQCVVSNNFGSAYSQRFKITVASYPGFRRTPSNVTLNAGNTARLDCSAYGEPMPQIAWQKDGGNDFPAARERRMHLMTADDAFFIINAKPVDMGVYTCTAENPAGIIKANATLTVYEKPTFVNAQENRQEVLFGKAFVIDCFTHGSPKPKIHWYKDEQPISASERHFFAAENQLLIIMNAAYSDAGTYHCEIKNKLGGSHQYLIVKVSKSISKAIVNGDEMTGIIIITIFCCTIVTSIIWIFIFYHTKKGSECNNNHYVGNTVGINNSPHQMNLHTRFLYQQQQQAVESANSSTAETTNFSPYANGNLPLSYDSSDTTSNKDSGTGDSTKRSRSVGDIHSINPCPNSSDSKPNDSYELSTYNEKGLQMMVLSNSASRQQPDLETTSSPQLATKRLPLAASSVTTSSNSTCNFRNNPTKQKSLKSLTDDCHIPFIECNGPVCSEEQKMPLIRNNDSYQAREDPNFKGSADASLNSFVNNNSNASVKVANSMSI